MLYMLLIVLYKYEVSIKKWCKIVPFIYLFLIFSMLMVPSLHNAYYTIFNSLVQSILKTASWLSFSRWSQSNSANKNKFKQGTTLDSDKYQYLTLLHVYVIACKKGYFNKKEDKS